MRARFRFPALGLFLLPWLVADAAVTLSGIFSDHAVLQRGPDTAVWGTAAPGEKVSVALGSLPPVSIAANERGRWLVRLNLDAAPAEPLELVARGENTVVAKDVLVGDVWLCSGQSNMEWKLGQTTDAAAVIAASADPGLRTFLPKRQAVPAPADDLQGEWLVAGPSTSARFSGVAYHFAKSIQATVPGAIGLVDTSWGGTPAEAWISSAGLDRLPELKPRKDAILDEQPLAEEKLRRYGPAYLAWAAKNGCDDAVPEDVSAYAAPEIATDGWKLVTLPGRLADAGLPDRGVVWLRREVDIPASRAGAYLPLLLGKLNDLETVYWNGRKIGETTALRSTSMNPDTAPTMNRRYDVPGDQVRAGRNVLSIRLVSPAGGAGVEARWMNAAWDISLHGEWRARVEREFPPLSAEALASYPRRPAWPMMPHYAATYLHNGMVHPLRDLGLRGVVWYQGEANTGRAYQYRDTFSRLIEDWRDTFRRPGLPFYFCQLANYQAKQMSPGESAWAELREAQARALALPRTGMAVLIDLGEEGDIHFRNKRDVGARLGAVALAGAYGREIPSRGPRLSTVAAEAGRLRLRFAPADGGLVAKALPETYRPRSTQPATKRLQLPSPDSELQGFAICGEDRIWRWARARIEGDAVVVWADGVPAPRFVRYAWADNPTCNLYDGAGFPAVPFRTDAFPARTANGKF